MYSIQTFAEQQSLFHNLIVRYGKLVEVKMKRNKLIVNGEKQIKYRD